ncbi:MAG: hypothetical protein WB711_01260 [Terriglobales bacterium]
MAGAFAIAPLWEARKNSKAELLSETAGSWHQVAGILRNSGFVLVGLLLMALPAAGQFNFGDFSTNLNGTLSTGYTGTYGNQIPSDHSLSFGGAGTFSGFYYNPNFLSFAISPYLNQARDNSSYQSLSNASGASASSSIFSGSHFPGSINYAKAYNSEGNFSIPGVANYTTHGDSETFGINWAEIVPGLPTLSANFQMGNSQYSIYGSNDNGTTDNHSFSLRSGYTLKGFNLGAYFGDGAGHSEIPQVLQNSTTEETSSSSWDYGFNVGHALPLRGQFASAFSSSEFSSDFAGGSDSGTVDTYTASAVFQPTQKFHFSFSTDYSNNLSGSLYEAVAGAGGVTQPINLGQGTHSLDLLGNASYSVMANMQAQAFADHREQYYLGESFSASTYGGGVSYWRVLFGGSFNAALSLSDNGASNSSQNSLGINSTVNYNRHFGAWVAGGSFTYAQNVQSALISYTTSSYSYGGNVRRRWGKFGWSGGAGASKTLLTEQAGTANTSESFNTSIFYSRYLTANANYSKSSGNAIETGLGLIQNPIPQPIIPIDDLILYGGKSYSFGLSSSPVRRLTLGASYSKSNADSTLQGIMSTNDNKMLNAIVQYQFRKMYFTGGYSNLVQGFSASGLPAANVSSFYLGVSRWFNFF